VTLRVHNTLTRQKEDFVPLKGKRVAMFVCGLTPQDYAHLGHAKTYVAFDVIARYLRHKGYAVFYVQNVTDIEDRIIEKMLETGRDWREIVRHHLDDYHAAMELLGVGSVNLWAAATDYIPEIVAQIQGLIDKGYAYVAADGSVYYDTTKFDGWGQLSGMKVEELKPGARVEIDERKRNPADFALWKAQKPGEPSWDSPWGQGRPGWHIEDTAITITHFGLQYDLHGGATELMFPHHEAEIAQAEAFTGVRPFVKYWLHTGLLNVGGEKMSKSLGNFWSLRDALAQYDPMVLRFFLVNAHYRSPLDYTPETLEEAKAAYARLLESVENARSTMRGAPDAGPADTDLYAAAELAWRDFDAAMEDDFNSREGLAAAFALAREVNRALAEGAGKAALAQAVAVFDRIGGILGLFRGRPAGAGEEALIDLLVEAREAARARRDFTAADAIRTRLGELGIQLQDAREGARWKRA
jgi:cysteinyl-tRNA synthetase